MANCDLMILFDDKSPRTGGAPISGTVVVNANKDVTCKGLTVTTAWSTHGRGNIDNGSIAEETIFTGQWQAGQEYRYPFKLATAGWPPSYYGSYINVGQYVTARAKLSWATDPKATVEYPVVALSAPEDLKPTTMAAKPAGLIGTIIGSIIAVVVIGLLIIPLGMAALLAVPILGIGGGIYWFFRVFLPSQITGRVECNLSSLRVAAGTPLTATMSFTPRRNSAIDGIEWNVVCIEEAVSGSGSNRQTHTYKVVDYRGRSADRMQLESGKPLSFEFQYNVPPNAAPTMKFSNNQIKWSLTARINIPGWPDWVKTLPLTIAPFPKADTSVVPDRFDSDDYDDDLEDDADDESIDESASASTTSPVVPVGAGSSSGGNSDEDWFKQVLGQMRKHSRGGPELSVIVGAVKDYVFPMEVRLDERTTPPLVSNEFDFEHLDMATWWNGMSLKHNAKVALAWNTPYSQVGAGEVWRGSAIIVGYDYEDDRVLMEVTGM